MSAAADEDGGVGVGWDDGGFLLEYCVRRGGCAPSLSARVFSRSRRTRMAEAISVFVYGDDLVLRSARTTGKVTSPARRTAGAVGDGGGGTDGYRVVVHDGFGHVEGRREVWTPPTTLMLGRDS